MMRVVTIITRLEGGAGVLALRGVRALDPAAYQPLIITGSGGRLLTEAAGAGIEVLVEPLLRPTIAPRSDLRAVRWLAAELASRRPDVVHTHCAKGGAIGRIAARRADISRIVHTYHGFPFHEFQPAARRHAYIAAERRLGRFTDAGLCVGTGVAVEAIRRGLIAPERVATIGVTLDRLSLDRVAAPPDNGLARQRARRRLGLAPGSFVVGSVGRLTYQKAPEDFVAAIAALGRPDVTGVWVGGGELAAAVARLAAASGQHIVLAGDRDDVADLLPAFDVFALPSRYEGLPTAVAEAMAAGIPVVATAVNAVPDLVEPGVTGLLVPPARPDLLAAGIGRLLDAPGAATAMAAAARARIGDRYGPAALQAALETAYQPAGPARPARRPGPADDPAAIPLSCSVPAA
jgi:glycosyltransferase involved in cell wall biosynthesis